MTLKTAINTFVGDFTRTGKVYTASEIRERLEEVVDLVDGEWIRDVGKTCAKCKRKMRRRELVLNS